jgi:hypothetical protein
MSDPVWVPELSPKGYRVFNFGAFNQPASVAPALLVSGPRETSKTISCMHKIARHLWEVPGARFVILGKTYKNVKEAGVVRDLIDFVMPKWIDAGVLNVAGKPFAYTTADASGNPGPKVDGSTRTWYFKIRNYWDGESELMLQSLDFDDDVELKFKNTRFSGIYIPEADRFKSDKVFTGTFHQLRMIHLRPDQHLWMADSNPAEEGPDHWLYKRFYTQDIVSDADARLYKNFEVIEMMFDDNPWLSDERKEDLKALYRHDPDLWNRYILGKWVKLKEQGGFADVFSKVSHVVGDAETDDTDAYVDPGPNVSRLICGWDLGTVNHSWHLIHKRGRTVQWSNDKGQVLSREEYCYDVLDELVYVGEKIKISSFTEEVMGILDGWEDRLKRWYGLKEPSYTHWSDQSAWRWKNEEDMANSTDQMTVNLASDGKIVLQKCMLQKARSVMKRMDLLRRLCHENRVFFSSRCKATIEMLQNMTDPKKRNNPYKHPFDSLTYGIGAEEPNALFEQTTPKAVKDTESRIISL